MTTPTSNVASIYDNNSKAKKARRKDDDSDYNDDNDGGAMEAEQFQYIERLFSIEFGWALLAVLSNGSLVSRARGNSVKRWLIASDSSNSSNKTLQLVGTYTGHKNNVCGVIEKDSKALITGSNDGTVKEWDVITCECLNTLELFEVVYCMAKSRDNSKIAIGLYDGSVLLRKADDLSEQIMRSNLHSRPVTCICELEDGSFVSGSFEPTIERWDEKGTKLQSFIADTSAIHGLTQLNSDIVVSWSHNQLSLWNLSTGTCFRTLKMVTFGLVKLSEERFITGGPHKSIQVWDDKGECLETIQSESEIDLMMGLDKTMVIQSNSQFTLWGLK